MRLPDIDATAPWNSCDIARYAVSSPKIELVGARSRARRVAAWPPALAVAAARRRARGLDREAGGDELAVRGALDVEVEREHAAEHGRVHRLHDRPAAGTGLERDEAVQLEHPQGLAERAAPDVVVRHHLGLGREAVAGLRARGRTMSWTIACATTSDFFGTGGHSSRSR